MEEEPIVHTLGNKTLADVVEAMIGAALLGAGLFEKSGLNAALQMVVALGIPVGGATSWDDYSKLYVPPGVEHDSHVFDLEDQWKIEDLVGYKFKNRKLLMQAFTHASMVNTNSPCYQRLEFLGDAVLEVSSLYGMADLQLTVVKHLYKKYPHHDPHHLTNLKCAIITNHFLSSLCVKIGLHRFIRYFSVSLPAAIGNYVTCLEDRKMTKGKNEFWLELEAPKVIFCRAIADGRCCQISLKQLWEQCFLIQGLTWVLLMPSLIFILQSSSILMTRLPFRDIRWLFSSELLLTVVCLV